MRKNILRTFIASVMIGSTLVVPAFAESATVTGNGVNFRVGPGTNYYVIGTLDSGTPVEVTDRSNGSWYAVSYGGYNGFISASYLSLGESYSPSLPSSAPVYSTAGLELGHVNAMYVRFRSGPGSDYSVLGEYNKGKELSILSSSDGWTACIIDGQLGYIYDGYVSKGSGAVSTSGGGVNFITPEASTQPSYGLPQPDEITGGSGNNSGSNGGVSFIRPDAAPAPTSTPTPVQTPTPTATPAPVQTPVQTPVPTTAPLPSPSSTPAPQATSNVPSSAQAGFIKGTYVRFRSGPGTNYSIINTYNTGKQLYVTGNPGNGWYQCVIDNVSGYVHGNYVLLNSSASSGGTPLFPVGGSGNTLPNPEVTPTPATTQNPAQTAAPTQTPTTTQTPSTQYKDAYITGNNVRFRMQPTMTSGVICELFYGNPVSLITAHDGWAQVIYNNVVGYVYSDYVKEGSYSASNAGSNSGSTQQPSAPSTGSATGQDIVNYALQFVGYNYTWGGTSPSTGFDCSGLVQYVYKQFGYSLNRVAADQAKNGRHVEASELQPGDILCFYSGSSYIGHVGIYMGNGQFVHASNSTTGVIISNLSGSYTNRGFEARRIIG